MTIFELAPYLTASEFSANEARRPRNRQEALGPQTVVGFDFDGTIAETFHPSPNGIGVAEAYQQTIKNIFGNELLTVYDRKGGLKNRAPGEVIRDLCCESSTKIVVEHARNFYNEHQNELDSVALEPFDWDKEGGIQAATEVLILCKLGILMEEIGFDEESGEIWPKLTPGFAEFWEGLSKNGTVTTVIISSGHDGFIKRVFELHNLAPPDVLITNDTVRFLEEPLYKPDRRLFELGLEKVRDLGGDPKKLVYFGDDLLIDGKFAKNSGSKFFHINTSGKKKRKNTFSDWNRVPWSPPKDPS